MTTNRPTVPVDAYARDNRLALWVFHCDGHSAHHGVSPRTLKAFARRGLVWLDEPTGGWGSRVVGGLTEKGLAVLAALEAESDK